jgi:hypothetical protein
LHNLVPPSEIEKLCTVHSFHAVSIAAEVAGRKAHLHGDVAGVLSVARVLGHATDDVRELVFRKELNGNFAAPDPKLMALEGELRTKLGTQVKIQRQGRGGKITIEFFSEDELANIVGRMAEHPSDAQDAGYIAV